MSQTTVNLGYVPKNRGEYSSTASYYKDNIVQYNGSSYICNPPNYDPDTDPTASITGVAPYASDPAVPNTGWAVFCNDSSGVGEGVYNVSVDHTTDNQPKIYASLSAALNDIPAAKKKGGMEIRFIFNNSNYAVDKEEGITTQPAGTAITSSPTMVDGTYKASQLLTYFSTLPTATGAGNAVVYYKEVDGTYTTWTITLQSSDNKYVRYNLLAYSFTTDITQWAIDDAGVYVDNPEYVYIKTDKEGRILWAIKIDGSIYYGAGCPQQVIDYIEERISELSLDEYEDIVAFLQDFLGADTTLKAILDSVEERKVDKVEGKGLIDSEYADSQSVIDNPEWADVKTDSEDKVLEGLKTNGTKVVGGDFEVGGDLEVLDKTTTKTMNVDGVEIKHIDNPEWIEIKTDANNKIVEGTKKDGSKYAYNIQSESLDNKVEKIEGKGLSENDYTDSDKELVNMNSIIQSPEFIKVELDAEGHILEATTVNNKKIINKNVDVKGNTEVKNASISGFNIDHIDDKEGRVEVDVDVDNKIMSYRDSQGVLHENVGLKPKSLQLPNDAVEQIEEIINTYEKPRDWYFPEFGKVTLTQETFYLTADAEYQSLPNPADKVVLIQMYADNNVNANNKRTLSYYYVVNSDLTGQGSDGNNYTGDLVTRVGGKFYVTSSLDGGIVTPDSIEVIFDSSSVDSNSKVLDFWPAKEVEKSGGHYYVKKLTKVSGHFYITSTLTAIKNNGTTIYAVNQFSTMVDVDLSADEQETLTDAIEVVQFTDVPPYKAWPVSKNLEHYCKADIDFGTYFSEENVPVSIKYQGSGSLAHRKRAFRITFYKNASYAKKRKVRIGEMVTLSGYNMKSYGDDNTRVKDPIASTLFTDMWESRGVSCYPWNQDSIIYNGAVGFVKSFPIETWIGQEFFGLQMFGLKKDEKNFMLDGDDDSSGIFITGAGNTWGGDFTAADWTDELDASGREYAYPAKGKDSVSVETAAAIDVLSTYIKGFIYGYIEYEDVENNTYSVLDVTASPSDDYMTGTVNAGGTLISVTAKTECTREMLEEHIDIASWIDYWIGLQIFIMYDNAKHNMVLHTRADKVKFYAFFYDLDQIFKIGYYDSNFIDYMYAGDRLFWEKFVDVYKESILNRYVSLRKGVLSDRHIYSIYQGYINGIPQRVIQMELDRWNEGNPETYDRIYVMLVKRLKWLDENYFALTI